MSSDPNQTDSEQKVPFANSDIETPTPAQDSEQTDTVDMEEIVDAIVVEDHGESVRDQLWEQPHWLHPMSPIFDIVAHIKQFIFPIFIAVIGASSGGFWGIYVALFFVVPMIGFTFFRFFTLRYLIRDGDLIVTQGLFFRRVRTVPVHRIQNVDLLQNLFHRIMRVAEVRVETASGSEPEAILRVLSISKVEDLRREIFKQRTHPGDAEIRADKMTFEKQLMPADSRTVLKIPTSWLVKAGLASNRGLLMVGVLVGLFFQNDLHEKIDLERVGDLIPKDLGIVFNTIAITILAILAIVLLRILGAVWQVLRFHGYQLKRHGEDLRLSCGLLTKISATIPRARVQFISIHQPLILRWLGFAQIRIETAGGAAKANEDATASIARRWFVPVIPIDKVQTVIHELRADVDWMPELYDWRPLAAKAKNRLMRLAVVQTFATAMIGLAFTRPYGFLAGLVLAPFFFWLAAKKSRSVSYARTEFGVAHRSGVLDRKMSITFFEKIQVVRLDESPFDRRWKMAQLSVDTAAAGPAGHKINIRYLDAGFAKLEYDRLQELTVRQN